MSPSGDQDGSPLRSEMLKELRDNSYSGWPFRRVLAALLCQPSILAGCGYSAMRVKAKASQQTRIQHARRPSPVCAQGAAQQNRSRLGASLYQASIGHSGPSFDDHETVEPQALRPQDQLWHIRACHYGAGSHGPINHLGHERTSRPDRRGRCCLDLSRRAYRFRLCGHDWRKHHVGCGCLHHRRGLA